MTPCYITALQCPYIIIYYYYHPIIPSKLYRQKIALNNLKCRPLSGCHQVRSAPHSDATDATGGEVFICPHAERFDAPSVWLTIQDRICRGVGRVEPPPLLISTPPTSSFKKWGGVGFGPTSTCVKLDWPSDLRDEIWKTSAWWAIHKAW